jgi:hypothetical protein
MIVAVRPEGLYSRQARALLREPANHRRILIELFRKLLEVFASRQEIALSVDSIVDCQSVGDLGIYDESRALVLKQAGRMQDRRDNCRASLLPSWGAPTLRRRWGAVPRWQR